MPMVSRCSRASVLIFSFEELRRLLPAWLTFLWFRVWRCSSCKT